MNIVDKSGCPFYEIEEGHGRFLYSTEGEESKFIFAVADRKAEPGEPISPDDPEKIRPLVGFIIQNPEKARVIAKALEQMADEMEKDELHRQWTESAEDKLVAEIGKEAGE